MKKIITASTFVLLSFAANAGYWDYSIYNYVDTNGAVVGKQYNHCFAQGSTTIGIATSTKVHVESGSCR
jgi:hypothetical protein